MSTITLTRQQLYERVWSEPMTKVAAEIGVSDVALKKTCRRLNVPTPERGYWAKLAVGADVNKPPLPSDAEASDVRVDIEANKKRREQAGEARAALQPDGPPQLGLPVSSANLHAVVADLEKVIRSSKPDMNGMIVVRNARLPALSISPASADRAIRSLSVLYTELESRGVILKTGSRGDSIAFWKDKDEIVLFAEEAIDTIERQPTPEERRRPSWEWKTKVQQPSGRLNFSLYSPDGKSGGRSKWKEGPRNQLEIVLYAIAERVWTFFSDEEAWRMREVERQRRLAEEALIRAEEEKRATHEKRLTNAGAARVTNLIRASEWWRLRQCAEEFIAGCERMWNETSGSLSKEQETWLSWARRQANALSPLAMGYPQPERDGAIDPASVTFGGPYPETRLLPLPPTMEKPAPQESGYQSASWQTPQPYPFWLSHQRH
jgi:hypothetical protein